MMMSMMMTAMMAMTCVVISNLEISILANFVVKK